MTQQEKEFNELQEYIDTIITTAKLLEYRTIESPRKTTTTIYTQSGKIILQINIYTTPNNIILKTTHNYKFQKLTEESHQTKINHLTQLLQAL